MTQNAVTPQYRYRLSQLKRRLIAGSFPGQDLRSMNCCGYFTIPACFRQAFWLTLTGILHTRFLKAEIIGYVNRILDFMHFHSVENPVQKVENPLSFAVSFSF